MTICFSKGVRENCLVNWTYVLQRGRINLRNVHGIVNISIVLGGPELPSKVNDIFFPYPPWEGRTVGQASLGVWKPCSLRGNAVQSIYQEIQYVISFDSGLEQESTPQKSICSSSSWTVLPRYPTIVGCSWWGNTTQNCWWSQWKILQYILLAFWAMSSIVKNYITFKK